MEWTDPRCGLVVWCSLLSSSWEFSSRQLRSTLQVPALTTRGWARRPSLRRRSSEVPLTSTWRPTFWQPPQPLSPASPLIELTSSTFICSRARRCRFYDGDKVIIIIKGICFAVWVQYNRKTASHSFIRSYSSEISWQPQLCNSKNSNILTEKTVVKVTRVTLTAVFKYVKNQR